MLGPLLFLLYDSDIKNTAPDISIKLFADDTNIFICGKSLEQTMEQANSSLLPLSGWFSANKLSRSIEKTAYSIFGKQEDSRQKPKIQLFNTDIKHVDCCKYLGVFVDSNLNWKDHTDYIYKKLSNSLVYFISYEIKLAQMY